MQAVTADDPGERHARITTTDYQMEFLIRVLSLGVYPWAPDYPVGSQIGANKKGLPWSLWEGLGVRSELSVLDFGCSSLRKMRDQRPVLLGCSLFQSP